MFCPDVNAMAAQWEHRCGMDDLDGKQAWRFEAIPEQGKPLVRIRGGAYERS